MCNENEISFLFSLTLRRVEREKKPEEYEQTEADSLIQQYIHERKEDLFEFIVLSQQPVLCLWCLTC